MLAMTAFGVGEVVGCFFIGYVIDKYGSKFSTLVILGILVILTGLTVTFIVMW